MTPPPPPPKDLIARGVKRPSPLGTAAFISLRALDPLVQYQLLARGLGARVLARLGLATLPPGPDAALLRTGVPRLDRLGLSHERLLLLGMAAGAAAKHIFWRAYVAEEQFPARAAVAVAGVTTLLNGLNSLLLLAAATSAAAVGRGAPRGGAVSGARERAPRVALPVAVGALLYVVGIALETGAEVQRKRFKADPANKGRLCRVGLWSWARHINYGGYVLWRMGYTMAAGGWVLGLVMGLLQAFSFVKGGTVSLDYYMSGKYKDQWGRYKEEVRWKLLPGLY